MEEKSNSHTKFYLILFIIAFTGFIAVNIGLRAEREYAPSLPHFSEEEAFSKLLNSKLFLYVALLLVVASVILLAIGIGLKIGGFSPIPQFSRNEILWNVWAILKSVVVIMFVYVLGMWLVYVLAKKFDIRLGNDVYSLLLDAVMKVTICLWIFIMLRYEYRVKPINLGIRFSGIIRVLFFSFLGYVGILSLVYAGGIGWSYLGEALGIEEEPNPVIILLFSEPSRWAVLFIVFVTVIITPLVEEFYFRVFTFSALRKRLNFWLSGVISSIYFAAIHIDFYSLLPILILGFFLAYLYERTQNFIAPVFVHALHNAVIVSLVLSAKNF